MKFAMIATFVRYSMIALGTHLASRGYFDDAVVDSLAGAAVALSAIIWFLVTKKTPEQER